MTLKKKILLLGRAGIGKTSLRLTIFEGFYADELLLKPISPTRGFTTNKYNWLDVDLGVFDTSGQELSDLLENEVDMDIIFNYSDIIIYMLDYDLWTNKREDVIIEIIKIKKIIKKRFDQSKFVIFFHKIDNIIENIREKELKNIKQFLKKKLALPIYFTSIHPSLIYSSYNAIYKIVSEFSEETTHFKKITDHLLRDKASTLIFITNLNNSIVVQSLTNDFDVNLINFSHNLFAQLNLAFEDMTNNDKIEHIMLSSSNSLNIIMKRLTFNKLNLKNIVCISHKLTINGLILLISQLRQKFIDYLYKGGYKKSERPNNKEVIEEN
ncbi:MAG: GTPase domain-containing protein [Promethearchaeota archaeon]